MVVLPPSLGSHLSHSHVPPCRTYPSSCPLYCIIPHPSSYIASGGVATPADDVPRAAPNPNYAAPSAGHHSDELAPCHTNPNVVSRPPQYCVLLSLTHPGQWCIPLKKLPGIDIPPIDRKPPCYPLGTTYAPLLQTLTLPSIICRAMCRVPCLGAPLNVPPFPLLTCGSNQNAR